MCVMFWSERGSFDVPHVFEALRFQLPRRRVLANVSMIISNLCDEEVVVGAVHRRAVKVEPAVWRWHRYSHRERDWVVSMISRLYKASFETGEKLIIKFDKEKMRGYSQDLTVARQETNLQSILLQHDDRNYGEIAERHVPFTPFVFGPFGPGTTWLYSFDISIEGRAFDILVPEENGCSVDGATILKGKILNEDLAAHEGSAWEDYFLKNICGNIIKPKRYDTMITNDVGTLPTCYRLCHRTHREVIEDKDLSKRVAWFTSDDPNQDFIIELEFSHEEAAKT